MSEKRLFLKGAFYSYVYIGTYLITGVLTTPLLLNYFQGDYFALLMLVYTIIMYINNIKFGIPESLAALVAKGKSKIQNISIIKKSYILLAYIITTFLIFFTLVSFIIEDWRFLLGDVYHLDEQTVNYVFYILIFCALIRLPLDLSLSVFIGFNEVYFEKIYKVFNLIANFLLVLYTVNTEQSILFFVIWAGILDILVSFISFIHSFIRYNILAYDSFDDIKVNKLLNSGFKFLQLSLTQTLIWSTGIFLVSHLLTLNEVTIYSITMKVYIYLFYAFIIINSVIAPIYGKNFAKQNWDKISSIFEYTFNLLPVAGGVIWIGTLFFMEDMIYLWTGETNLFIGNLYIFFMGVYFYFTAYVNTYITLLYSIGNVQNIIKVRWKEVVFNIAISFVLLKVLGISGIAIGMVVALIFTSVISLPIQITNATDRKVLVNRKLQLKQLIIMIPFAIISWYLTIYDFGIIIKICVFVILSILYIIGNWAIFPQDFKILIKNLLSRRA